MNEWIGRAEEKGICKSVISSDITKPVIFCNLIPIFQLDVGSKQYMLQRLPFLF